MKTLECLRMKDQIQELKEIYGGSENEMKKLNYTNEELRKNLKENNDRRLSQRKNYEKLKDKYRAVLEKAKLKGVREYELQDSINFSNIGQKTQPTPSTKSSASLMMSEGDVQMKMELPKNGFKKPGFPSGSMIGGLKKK